MILPDGLSECELSGPQPDHYVLRVEGGWVLDERANLVIVRPQRTSRDGDLALVVVDGQSLGIRRVYRDGGCIRLENDDCSETFDERRVTIQGIVIGIVREY